MPVELRVEFPHGKSSSFDGVLESDAVFSLRICGIAGMGALGGDAFLATAMAVAAEYLFLLALLGAISVEASHYGFHKIPCVLVLARQSKCLRTLFRMCFLCGSVADENREDRTGCAPKHSAL
jgi:hypothetical protein